MKISRCGGVIAAAHEQSAFPLHRIGETTAVKRIVMTFRQAGIFPMVVMSGAEADAVRDQLSSSGVVILQRGRPNHTDPAGRALLAGVPANRGKRRLLCAGTV